MDWLDIETPVQSLRISVKWREMDKQYKSYSDRGSANYIPTKEGRKKAREELLTNNPEYAKDRYRRNAYETDGFPENLIETYATYYTSPALKKPVDWRYDEWYEDDWFKMENPEFYKAMVDLGKWTEKDFLKVPTRLVWGLYEMYLTLDKGEARLAFRRQNPTLDAWLVLAKGFKPVKPPKPKKKR